MSLPPPVSPTPSPASSDDCPFCSIAHAHPPTAISTPPSSSTAHTILSTPTALAFLDIFPLSPCHILLIPRRHAEKVADLLPGENAVLGAWLPILARAAQRVTGWEDFNVVQNNGVSAAQVVPHVHYHIIPRPNERQREQLAKDRSTGNGTPIYWKSPFGTGVREELDDDDAAKMVVELRREVEKLVSELKVERLLRCGAVL
ncbi:HIT-like protein [Ascodesmis nigricans]|uniref:HIT-like protein n=1 Tax=Ascodesmis nigricans TaxID=341454 RepID=A0A4S2MZX3_9PEZI|nr:HIT-like protein [Ascodesmis nigricans]